MTSRLPVGLATGSTTGASGARSSCTTTITVSTSLPTRATRSSLRAFASSVTSAAKEQGVGTLGGNQFADRLQLWLMDPEKYPETHYLRAVPKRVVHVPRHHSHIGR